MKEVIKITNNNILILILITATILRFFNFHEIPFTHDEFSAIFRTNFKNFAELIEKGVKIDGHPAGIQVFLYYWTRLFGTTEWVVKLPFAIFGILSVYLIFLIAEKWFNESVGLISAAFLASIQYTVMYSQIARPYISGLFFSLLMVYYWSKIIRTPERQFLKNSIIFIISASLCTYNHHFSLLFAALVGFSGLFLIRRQYVIKYLVSGIIIFILYLPHLNIFLYQLSIGGIEGWLGKPQNDFILKYIAYTFNFSNLSLLLVLFLIMYGYYRKPAIERTSYKLYLLFGCWFLIPFLTGFLYSRFGSAVLQYSVLIFSFPYLLFLFFGHIKNLKPNTNLTLVSLILVVNIFSLVYSRQHYKLFYNSPFKEIIIDYQEAKNSNKNMLSIIDSHEKISKYYLSELKIDSDFVWFSSFGSEKEFKQFIEEKSKEYSMLYFGALSSNNPLTIPVIEDYFPGILTQKNYVGGASYLFSKEDNDGHDVVNLLNFELIDNISWGNINNSKFIDSFFFSEHTSYLIDSLTEYGPTFTGKLDTMITHENNFIDISIKVRAKNPENLKEVFLIAQLESNNKLIDWGGTNFEKLITGNSNKDEWITIHYSIKLSDVNMNFRDIILKTFIWNKGGNTFSIDDFKIKVREGNPVVYGLIEKFN